MDKDKVEILKLKISKGGLDTVLKNAIDLIENNEKFYVCAPNAYVTVKANEDKELLEIINNAKIVIPDGMPLVWYSRTFKKFLLGRISGFDFFYNFSKVADKRKYSYFFMGGRNKGVLGRIKERLGYEFKNINVKGYYCAPFIDTFSSEVDSKIIDVINKCNPDILWVGLSAPKQEKWIYKNINKLSVKMAAGIGAVFNFYAGEVKRAPKWMQKVGLEWLYRIIVEHRRLLKKYLIYNTKFILLVLKDIFKRVFKLN